MSGMRGPKPDLFVVDELESFDSESVRKAYVVRFGPQCAAWLVNRFRRQLKKRGAFFLRAKVGEELEPWLRIARDFLRDHRSNKWVVEESSSGSTRYIAVRRRGRPIPMALLPVGST